MTITMELAGILLMYRTNFKMFHWTTLSYAKHKASCDLVNQIDTHIDTIIETYSARYGRPKGKYTIEIVEINDGIQYCRDFTVWLIKEFPTYLDPRRDFDLLNTRDELLGAVEQAIYLFQLK